MLMEYKILKSNVEDPYRLIDNCISVRALSTIMHEYNYHSKLKTSINIKQWCMEQNTITNRSTQIFHPLILKLRK